MTTAFHETDLTLRRRPRRGQAPADVTAFRRQVDQAMDAFQADVSYAVLMARAAVTISRKRDIWQARRAARAAEAERGSGCL